MNQAITALSFRRDSTTLKGLAMAKKKTAKKIAPQDKITMIVPDAIAALPDEVLERVGALIGVATSQYDVAEVEIVAASDVKCTAPAGVRGWDKIINPGG
jgi:hypothetical protein